MCKPTLEELSKDVALYTKTFFGIEFTLNQKTLFDVVERYTPEEIQKQLARHQRKMLEFMSNYRAGYRSMQELSDA